VTAGDLTAEFDKLKGRRRANARVALKSLFGFVAKKRRIFHNPAPRIKGEANPVVVTPPLDQATTATVTGAATTPALRLIVALAAIHAARPASIRRLVLEDVDHGDQRITIDGHQRPLGDFTHRILLDWLEERRARWPHTANRHLLISRITGNGTGPVSTFYLEQELFVRHRVRLDDIRADRLLEEALHRGPDALHLTAVFGANAFTAMRYAEIARQLLQDPETIT
jgi:integrase